LYREDIEEVAGAGGAVIVVGVQYYPFSSPGSNDHSAARIQQIFQNLSVTGLPISLTEFGVQTNNGTTTAQAATYLNETMRMVFGTPQATTFMMWGFWANDVWTQAPLAALVDANWNITPAGAAYQQLMSQWTTDVTLPVGPDGAIDFTGFFGDYEITIDRKTYRLSLEKGTTDYQLAVSPLGDFDGDLLVSDADLAAWHAELGKSTLATREQGDADGDGDVDGGDFLVWQRHYGRGAAGDAPAIGVPEPSGAALACWSLAVLMRGACGIRRPRRRFWE
jgi:hypothetical protein